MVSSATPVISGPLTVIEFEAEIRALVTHWPNRKRPATDLHPECVDIWDGGKGITGQGTFTKGSFTKGSFTKGSFTIDAGEAVWILANGPLPASKTVARRCEHPPCVTLVHLYPIPKVTKHGR